MRRYWKSFLGLSFNQKVTIIVAMSSLLASIAASLISGVALYLSATSKDMKEAIGQLQILAKQSQSQTEYLKRQQQTYENNSKRDATDTAQEYRRFVISVLPLNLPTTKNVGQRYVATMVLTNVGSFPIPLENRFWGVTLTKKSPDERAREIFKDAQEYMKTSKDGYITLSPGESYPASVSPYEPVSNDMLNYLKSGYRLIAYAAFSYKDPRGTVHHAYICRFSDIYHVNQTCPTPLPD